MDEHQQEHPQAPITPPNQQPSIPGQQTPPWESSGIPQGQPPAYPYPPPYQQGAPHYGAVPPNTGGPPGYVPQQPGFSPPYPSQPARKGLQWWHWLLIGSAGLLVICCVVGVITASQGSQNQNNQSGAAIAATHTNAPATPTSSPTPLPLGQGKHMALGADYTHVGQDFTIVQPKGTFHAADSLAYVITLDGPIGTTQAQLILAREESGGVEASVFSQDVSISNPNFTELANRIPNIGSVMSAYNQGSGSYKIALSDGHQILAEATFTYVAS